MTSQPMSSISRKRSPVDRISDDPLSSISEEASHREHRAALEATLFHAPSAGDELVFELEDGELRLCPRRW